MKEKGKMERSTLYRWAKRLAAILAVGIWFALILSIFQGGGGMKEQAPQCLFTTMIVFAILTAVYKGIEALEARENPENSPDDSP